MSNKLLIEKYNYLHQLKSKKHRPLNKKIKYSLNFVSIISPGTITNTHLIFSNLSSVPNKKLLIKQSYLLLTWILYITTGKSKTQNIHKPKISIKPSKQTKFTLTKAPMAHKTFSQEQFIMKFYKFKITFSVPNINLNSVNTSLFLLLSLRSSSPNIETNFLFLKKFQINFFVQDNIFMRLG